MSKMVESRSVRAALEGLICSVIRRETRDCLRIRKAIVETAPDGSVCEVKLNAEQTVLSLPYSSKCSGVSAGDVVYVAFFYGMRNAIVWETEDFQ